MRGVRNLSGVAGPNASLAQAGSVGGRRVLPNTGPKDPASLIVTHTLDITGDFTGAMNTNSNGQSLAVKGNTVYVTDEIQSRIVAFDYSNPVDPKVASHYTDSAMGNLHRLYVEGDHLYASAGGKLNVFDISDPNTLNFLGSHSHSHYSSLGYLTGDGSGYLFGGRVGGTEGIISVDISDPANPIARDLDTALDTYAFRWLDYANGTVYIALYNNGTIARYDVSNPLNLTYIGSTAGAGANANGEFTITPDKQNLLWVHQTADRLKVGDVSTGGLSIIGSVDFSTTHTAEGVLAVGNTAYVFGVAMRAVDISDPATPVEVGFVDNGGSMTSAVIVADAIVGLQSPNTLVTIQ